MLLENAHKAAILMCPFYLFLSPVGNTCKKQPRFQQPEPSLSLIESIKLQSVCEHAISSNWLILLNVTACLAVTHKGPLCH